MYFLIDTFNRRVLSGHRLHRRAEQARKDLARELTRRSPGSYLPTVIVDLPNRRAANDYADTLDNY